MSKEISIDQGAIFCIIVCHTTTVKYTSTVHIPTARYTKAEGERESMTMTGQKIIGGGGGGGGAEFQQARDLSTALYVREKLCRRRQLSKKSAW